MLNKKLKNVGIERYMQFLIYVDVLLDDIFLKAYCLMMFLCAWGSACG
jgi:hypothetical protein